MHIHKDLVLACSTDLTRPVLKYVYVDVDTCRAVATDGTILVWLPILPEEGEVSGYVPHEAIAYAGKLRGDQHGRLFHGATTTMVQGVHFPNPFADEDAPPKFVQYEGQFIDHPSSVRIDVALLARLARALCGSTTKQRVTMYFTPGRMQLELRPVQGEGRGLLAQLRPW